MPRQIFHQRYGDVVKPFSRMNVGLTDVLKISQNSEHDCRPSSTYFQSFSFKEQDHRYSCTLCYLVGLPLYLDAINSKSLENQLVHSRSNLLVTQSDIILKDYPSIIFVPFSLQMALKLCKINIFPHNSFCIVHVSIDHFQNVLVIDFDIQSIVRFRVINFKVWQADDKLLPISLQEMRPFIIPFLIVLKMIYFGFQFLQIDYSQRTSLLLHRIVNCFYQLRTAYVGCQKLQERNRQSFNDSISLKGLNRKRFQSNEELISLMVVNTLQSISGVGQRLLLTCLSDISRGFIFFALHDMIDGEDDVAKFLGLVSSGSPYEISMQEYSKVVDCAFEVAEGIFGNV